MRAFVLTLDAFVAVALLFSAVFLMYSTSFQPYAPRGVYLKQFTSDMVTVMEKNGDLAAALEGNTSGMHYIMSFTPQLVCMQVSITDSTGNQSVTLARDGCGEYGRELQVIMRSLIHSGQLYTVKAEAWYMKEASP